MPHSALRGSVSSVQDRLYIVWVGDRIFFTLAGPKFLMTVTWECRISKLLMMPGRKGKLGRSHIQSYIHIEEGTIYRPMSTYIYISIYIYIYICLWSWIFKVFKNLYSECFSVRFSFWLEETLNKTKQCHCFSLALMALWQDESSRSVIFDFSLPHMLSFRNIANSSVAEEKAFDCKFI